MSDITKIAELRTKDEGNWDDWPYPTITITSLITGDLRARILAKLGLGELGVVTIEESEVSGGYSEFTQETDYDIRVMVDGQEHWKHEEWTAESTMAAFLQWSGSTGEES